MLTPPLGRGGRAHLRGGAAENRAAARALGGPPQNRGGPPNQPGGVPLASGDPPTSGGPPPNNFFKGGCPAQPLLGLESPNFCGTGGTLNFRGAPQNLGGANKWLDCSFLWWLSVWGGEGGGTQEGVGVPPNTWVPFGGGKWGGGEGHKQTPKCQSSVY